jgi:hypothetical protein
MLCGDIGRSLNICYALSFRKGKIDSLSLLIVISGRIRLAVNHATPNAINPAASP